MSNFALHFNVIVYIQNIHIMNKLQILTISAATVLLGVSATSCTKAQKYAVESVERSRILVDARYDNSTDPMVQNANATLLERKKRVDAEMNPVQGYAAHDLQVGRPESALSNLLADILVWGSERFGEKPDFAVYNIGGIRASLSKGEVTRGNILEVAPFENKICFLSLRGSDVLELFAQIAARGGEGLSHELRLTASADGKLLSATVGGKPIDPNASYRVATLDYLAQGNDHMEAFKKKTNVVAPQGENNNVRFLIEQYFNAAKAEGKAVDCAVEGRMVIAK